MHRVEITIFYFLPLLQEEGTSRGLVVQFFFNFLAEPSSPGWATACLCGTATEKQQCPLPCRLGSAGAAPVPAAPQLKDSWSPWAPQAEPGASFSKAIAPCYGLGAWELLKPGACFVLRFYCRTAIPVLGQSCFRKADIYYFVIFLTETWWQVLLSKKKKNPRNKQPHDY